MSSKFYKCALFSYYIDSGIRWFKILGLKLSFKHIKNYKFNTDKPKGYVVGWWLITMNIKN